MPHEPAPEDQDEYPPEETWQHPHLTGRPAIVPPPNLARRARNFVLRHWEPKPLEPPVIDAELEKLTPVERSTEALRHFVLSLEYWLSPKGALRAWIRFNLRLAAVLAVPCLLVVPLVTFALRQIRAWVEQVVQSTSSFIMFPLSALLIVGLISALLALSRSLLRQRQMQRRGDPYYYQ